MFGWLCGPHVFAPLNLLPTGGMAFKKTRPHWGSVAKALPAGFAGGNSGVSTCTKGTSLGMTAINPSFVSSCSQRTPAKPPLNSGQIQSRQPVMVLLYLFSRKPGLPHRKRFFQTRYGPLSELTAN
jgi:hypothetical protein